MYTKSVILDEEVLSRVMCMLEKEKYLSEHPYRIYQGRSGRWYTYLKDGNKRRKIERKTKEDIENAVVEHYKALYRVPTINDIFNSWNDRRVEMGKIKEATTTRYRTDFERFFGPIKDREINNILPEELSDFLEEQVLEHNLSAKAFSNLKTLLRGTLKRAKKLKLLNYPIDPIFTDIDISEKDFRKRPVDDSKEIFYDDERERIVTYCSEHRNKGYCLAILLIFATGLRIGEVVSLKRGDIFDDEIYVHRTETRWRKDGCTYYDVSDDPKTFAGIRRVVVPRSFKWVLDILRDGGTDEWVFVGPKGNRLHADAIRENLYRICAKLDIPKRPPHKIRKTYGSILLDNNVDAKFIEKQMGHTDILTTKLHYYRDRKRLDQKREIINSISEFG